MAISMTNHAPGMTAEAYDQVMSHVGGALRGCEGFISHRGTSTATETCQIVRIS